MNAFTEIVKDYGPVIVGCLAVYMGNRNITKQIRKSSRVQWIDTFRQSIVKLMSLNYKFENDKRANNPELKDSYSALSEQITYITLLLNKHNVLQAKLWSALNELKDITDQIIVNKLTDETYNDLGKKIFESYSLSEKIIYQEQAKI